MNSHGHSYRHDLTKGTWSNRLRSLFVTGSAVFHQVPRSPPISSPLTLVPTAQTRSTREWQSTHAAQEMCFSSLDAPVHHATGPCQLAAQAHAVPQQCYCGGSAGRAHGLR
jgi:hypothetical protein